MVSRAQANNDEGVCDSARHDEFRRTSGGAVLARHDRRRAGGRPALRDPSADVEMFRHHAEMKRTASDIPGGIRAVTESEDPRVASLIQEHVSAMYAHLDREQPFPYPMSRSVPKMFANSSRYHRRLTILPKGIAVTETSNDPEMIQVIRLHAREINGFVNDGMPAMMRGMM